MYEKVEKLHRKGAGFLSSGGVNAPLHRAQKVKSVGFRRLSSSTA